MNNHIALSLGRSIKRRRRAISVTQETLAHAICISPRSLQSIEAGDFQPSFSTLFKISKFLQTTPENLLNTAWNDWLTKKQ